VLAVIIVEFNFTYVPSTKWSLIYLGKAYQVNVTSLEAVQEAVDAIVKEFNGRLDVFVANSGVAWEQGPFLDGGIDHYRKVMSTNVDGSFWCARAAGMHFRRQKQEGTTVTGEKLEGYTQGSFIATASMSGHIVNIPQMQAAYNASKAAVIHMCKSGRRHVSVSITRRKLTPV
jgi:sorbose reductase